METSFCSRLDERHTANSLAFVSNGLLLRSMYLKAAIMPMPTIKFPSKGTTQWTLLLYCAVHP